MIDARGNAVNAAVSRHHRVGEILRFLVGGASTTFVSYAIYVLLLHWFPYVLAYSIAYVAGIAWSYFANTLFVFKRAPSLARAALFPLVYVAQYVVGMFLLVLLVKAFDFPKAFAPLAVVVLTLPLTYVLSRHVIMAERAPTSSSERSEQ